MERCTICGTESKENICPVCGNERTADAVRHGTFAPLPKAAADIRNDCIAKYKARLAVENKANSEHKPTFSYQKYAQEAIKQQQEEAEERAKKAEAELHKEHEELKRQLEETAQANKQQTAPKFQIDEAIKQEPSPETPPKQKAKTGRWLTMLELAVIILGALGFVVILVSYILPLPFAVQMIAAVFLIVSLVILIKDNK